MVGVYLTIGLVLLSVVFLFSMAMDYLYSSITDDRVITKHRKSK